MADTQVSAIFLLLSGFTLLRECTGQPGVRNVQRQIQAAFFALLYDLFAVTDTGIRQHQLNAYFVGYIQILYLFLALDIHFNDIFVCHVAVVQGVSAAHQRTAFISGECCSTHIVCHYLSSFCTARENGTKPFRAILKPKQKTEPAEADHPIIYFSIP